MLINVENGRDAREAVRAAHSWVWAQLEASQGSTSMRRLESVKDHLEEALEVLKLMP
jgi:hypothetical protein